MAATQAGKDVPIKLEANYKARVANLILDTLRLRHERLMMLKNISLYFIFRFPIFLNCLVRVELVIRVLMVCFEYDRINKSEHQNECD